MVSHQGESAKIRKRGSSARVAFFKESFRSLALNLRYIPNQDQGKVLLVTSSTSQEGKSTVTYYLAHSLAQLDFRVLVVDADMRRPTQHELFNDLNAVGLSTLFMSHQDWQQLICTTEIDNLHVLMSGPTPPDPGALLSSQRVPQLIQEWRQAFDYILIDTPPVLGIADVESIQADIEGVVFVTGMRQIHRAGLRRACETLQRSRHKLVGLVVNMDETVTGSGYYAYGYRSYY